MTIQEFFQQNPACAVAFSGGVDSAWLLHEAVKYARQHGCEDIAVACGNYYVPYFEKCGFVLTGFGPEGNAMTLDIRRVIRDIPKIDTP